MGTMGHLKSVKNDKKTFKIPTGIRNQKKSEKVWIWDPPEPQKVGFRLRGVQIFTNPPEPLKITKSHKKGSKMSSKWSPRGPKERPRTPRNPLKNREGKRHQKGAQNKPVLAWEREARLKEESLPNMVLTSVQTSMEEERERE